MRRQIQSCAANLLLRELLARETGHPAADWRLAWNRSGKPMAATGNGPGAIEVSISHSGPLVAAAVTDLGEIGIDLEFREPRRPLSGIAEYAFGPEERRTAESHGLRGFYRIWTLREALAKACGSGFPMLADGCDYFADAPTWGNWQCRIGGRRWLFWSGDLPGGYAVAVALAPRQSLAPGGSVELAVREFKSQAAQKVSR